MKTLWNDTEQAEAHLYGLHNTGDALLFEAKLLLNPELQDTVLWQQKTYNIISQYSRKQLKQEIAAVHQQLFTAPEHLNFSQKIKRLFKNQ